MAPRSQVLRGTGGNRECFVLSNCVSASCVTGIRPLEEDSIANGWADPSIPTCEWLQWRALAAGGAKVPGDLPSDGTPAQQSAGIMEKDEVRSSGRLTLNITRSADGPDGPRARKGAKGGIQLKERLESQKNKD